MTSIQGDQKRLWLVIFLWRNQKNQKLHKPNDFWKPYIGRFWYFDVQYVSGANYSFVSGLWQNGVTAPYCRDWEPRYPKTHPSAFNFHECHSDTPRYPSDTPHTPPRHPLDISREQEMSTDANRHRQMYSNSTCQCLWVSGAVCLCLVASVVVCWHLLLPRNVCWVSGGCLVSVWGCQRDIHGDRRHSDVFGIIWVLSPCSMEP